MHRCLAVLIGVLALLSSAQAADLQIQGRSQLRVDVTVSDATAQVEFRTEFHANATGQGYLKALPSTGNVVFLNGTPEAGWWTHAVLERDGTSLGEAGTNGTTVAVLGDLEAGLNYTLRLLVNVPAEALQQPGQQKLAYALAVNLDSAGSGSGGSLDPSVSILPRIDIVEPEPEQQGAGTGSSGPRDPHRLLTFGLVAAVGLLAGVRTVVRRRSITQDGVDEGTDPQGASRDDR